MKYFLLSIVLLISGCTTNKQIQPPNIIKIGIVNNTTSYIVTEQEILVYEEYVNTLISPSWSTPQLKLINNSDKEQYTLFIETKANVANAIGYHDIDMNTGKPFAMVFLKESTESKIPLSVVITHELGEIMVNPWTDVYIKCDHNLYFAEIADPVQRHWFDMNGIAVSNFVYPNWYRKDTQGPYDYMNITKDSLDVNHGYQSWITPGTLWVRSNFESVTKDRQRIDNEQD